jgi:hypothetical protein
MYSQLFTLKAAVGRNYRRRCFATSVRRARQFGEQHVTVAESPIWLPVTLLPLARLVQVRRRRYFENSVDAKKRKRKESRMKAKRCACQAQQAVALAHATSPTLLLGTPVYTGLYDLRSCVGLRWHRCCWRAFLTCLRAFVGRFMGVKPYGQVVGLEPAPFSDLFGTADDIFAEVLVGEAPAQFLSSRDCHSGLCFPPPHVCCPGLPTEICRLVPASTAARHEAVNAGAAG